MHLAILEYYIAFSDTITCERQAVFDLVEFYRKLRYWTCWYAISALLFFLHVMLGKLAGQVHRHSAKAKICNTKVRIHYDTRLEIFKLVLRIAFKFQFTDQGNYPIIVCVDFFKCKFWCWWQRFSNVFADYNMHSTFINIFGLLLHKA